MSDPMSRPIPPKLTKKKRYPSAPVLLAAITFVANATAITGLLLSHVDVIIITAAVMVVLYGWYLFLTRWGKPIDWFALLATVIIAVGSGTLVLAVNMYNNPDESTGIIANDTTTDTDTDTDTDDKTGSTSSRGGKPVKSNSKHDLLFEKSFTFRPQDGMELDDEVGSLYSQQSGAESPIDLYLSDSAYVLYVTIKQFYKYQPLETSTGDADKDQYLACKDLIENSQVGDTYLYASSVIPNQQYCVYTTRGRVALITMQEMISQTNGSKNGADITVKLWN